MAATASAPRRGSRPLIRTVVPRVASSRAVWYPMPEVAPVTSAILSSSCGAPCRALAPDPAGAGRPLGSPGRDGSVIAASPASSACALLPSQPPDDQDQGRYQPLRCPALRQDGTSMAIHGRSSNPLLTRSHHPRGLPQGVPVVSGPPES